MYFRGLKIYNRKSSVKVFCDTFGLFCIDVRRKLDIKDWNVEDWNGKCMFVKINNSFDSVI